MKRFAAICLALVLSLPLCMGQNQQRKEIERLQKEIEAIDAQIKANDSKSADAAARLALVRSKIGSTKQLVSQSEKELKSIDSQIRSTRKELAETQEKLDNSLAYYESLVKSAYISRDVRFRFLYILSGKSLSQIVRRFDYLRSASDNLRAEAESISRTKLELEQRQASLDSLKTQSSLVFKRHKAELQSLNKAESKEQQIVKDLKNNKKKYQAEIKNKKKQIEQLNKKIAEIIAAQEAKRKSKTPSEYEKALSKEFLAGKGKLPMPVDGTVVGFYGKHKHPVYKNVDLPFNNGINISTAADAKVHSVFEGVVSQIVVMPGYNQCVLLQHGEYFTFYCKLKNVNVKSGDKVWAGDVLGTVDTIAGETQLHFQLWKGTSSQDPLPWLEH